METITNRLDTIINQLNKVINLLERQISKEIDWYPAMSTTSSMNPLEITGDSYFVNPDFKNDDISIVSNFDNFKPAYTEDILYKG